MDVITVFIFFVYGLAFFILGFAILLYPKKDSSFKFASDLWLIAAFGISHGINEWLDMFLLFWKPQELTIIRAIILPVSFLFLVQFAITTIVEAKRKYWALKAIPYILFTIWALLTALNTQRLLMGDILARYLNGTPGIFLTSYALILKLTDFKEIKLPRFHVNLRLSAGAFLFYGVFSGLFVPEAGFFPAAILNYGVFLDKVGVPVQVFRAFCAITLAYSMTGVLNVFEYETKTKVKKSEELFRTIFDNAMDGILLADVETKKFYTGNRTIYQMLGYSPEECKNLHIMDIHPTENVPYVIDQFEKQAHGEDTLAKEIPVKRKNGDVFFADINASLITLDERKYVMGIFRDITERKASEERNRRHLEQLASLRSIDMAIRSSLDLQVTLQILLNYTITHLAVDAADILLYKPHVKTLEYTAGHGFRTQALQHAPLKLGESPAGQAALEQRMVHIPDLRKIDDEYKRSVHLKEEGFVSYYAIPFIAKGEVKGVLEIFKRTGINPDQEWLDFLNTLAGQAAIAVDSSLLFENLQRSNADLIMAYDETIEGWSRALDLRDKETEGHSQRVTDLTLRIATAMGISEAEQADMRRGALLHDIGKMGIPDSILLKPGPLNDEELEIMRKHPVFGYEMLSPIRFLRAALDIPYCHHERWDGKGYPRGLKGEQIPLAARIFALTDVCDALRSDRPYRPAWPKERIFEHIRSLTGNHLDRKVVEVFLELGKKNFGL